jgi:hypothetical protein
MKRSSATKARMYRIKLLPVFMANLEPKKPPPAEQSIQGIAIGKNIFPLKNHVSIEAIFDERLITFVVPTDLISSICKNPERTSVMNMPVPGPKNPS